MTTLTDNLMELASELEAGSSSITQRSPTAGPSFVQRLDAAIGKTNDFGSARAAVAGILQQSFATCVAWYTGAGRRIGEETRLDGLTVPLEGLPTAIRKQLLAGAAQACLLQSLATLECGASGIVMAVALPRRPREALAVYCDATSIVEPDGRSAECELMLQLAASRLSFRDLEGSLQRAEQNADHVAALIELVGLLETCRDPGSAAERLARELLNHLNATRVMVGLCADESGSCAVVADTGQQTIDERSEATRQIQAVLQESIAREAGSLWPSDEAENRHALLAHRQLAEFTSSVAVTACPVTDDDGRTVGAICLTFAEDGSGDADRKSAAATQIAAARNAVSFLAAAKHPLAVTFGLIDRTSETPLKSVLRTGRRLFGKQRWRTIGCIVAVVAAVLAIPGRYTIDCDAELQPVARRFVAVPFDGTLKNCFVRPGDVVDQDMLLARMDDREIHWELAGIRADMSRARNERDTHLADHAIGEAEIARHEVARLKNRSDLMTFRNDHLEFRSPIDGIVVSGDHRDQEGIPLKTGDTLFEIAPMDAMIIEVAVPEEDMRWVRPKMPVRLQLDSMPATLFDATIVRVLPRAELKDRENVFIAEAELRNDEGLLRPGMRGTARIRGERHPLAWNLFHKPVAHLTGWLGW